MQTELLNETVIALHNAGAFHKRRGFRLDAADERDATNHLLEEAVELQAECFRGRYQTQINEAADLLGVFLHLLWMMGIPLPVVVERCAEKLKENFTLDPSEVETATPGFTRGNR